MIVHFDPEIDPVLTACGNDSARKLLIGRRGEFVALNALLQPVQSQSPPYYYKHEHRPYGSTIEYTGKTLKAWDFVCGGMRFDAKATYRDNLWVFEFLKQRRPPRWPAIELLLHQDKTRRADVYMIVALTQGGGTVYSVTWEQVINGLRFDDSGVFRLWPLPPNKETGTVVWTIYTREAWLQAAPFCPRGPFTYDPKWSAEEIESEIDRLCKQEVVR